MLSPDFAPESRGRNVPGFLIWITTPMPLRVERMLSSTENEYVLLK